MNRLPFLVLILALALFSPPPPALSTPDSSGELLYPEEIAARLQARYDAMGSLAFNFYQETQGEMTGRPRRGSGRAVFYKADGIGRMRWDYSSPDLQVLVSDGKFFRMYFAELRQMIVSPAENLDSELTYAFFTGKGSLARDFHIRPADEDFQTGDEALFRVIKLIPKVPQAQVQDVHLWVTTDSLIRRFGIRDHFGTLTVLNLSDIEVDSLQHLSEKERSSLFSFTPPPETEIIEQ
jgi:outer membrane lipoprotein carrier protein